MVNRQEWRWTGGPWAPTMLYKDAAGTWLALDRRAVHAGRKARRCRCWQYRAAVMRSALRDRSVRRLAAITAGVWIARALVLMLG